MLTRYYCAILLGGKPADPQTFLDRKLRNDVTFHLQPVAKGDIVRFWRTLPQLTGRSKLISMSSCANHSAAGSNPDLELQLAKG